MYLSTVSSRLMLYDAYSWDLKKSYGCYDGLMRDMSWSDDGKYILQVNSKGVVEILSAADHEVRCLQHIPIKDTWSASFHRDGHSNIAIGTKSGNVMIWDTKNKSITKTFSTPTHQSCVNHISYNAKNTSLAATMLNGETVIYSLVSNIPVSTVNLHCSESISAMKFHHESRSLLGLATDEGHVVLRDITTNKTKASFENIHASIVSDFAYSLVNKDVVLSTGYDKIMNVYDIRIQNVVSTIRTSYTLTCLSINLDNQVALGTINGPVLIYDLRDLTNPISVLNGQEEEVRRVSFQPPRKKQYSTEVSLREDTDSNLSPHKVSTPVRTRTPDMFYVTDTPPEHNLEISAANDNKADSFLVMMGLDKSAENDDVTRSEYDESANIEARYKQLDAEINLSKASTPLNSNKLDNLEFLPPTETINGILDDRRTSNLNVSDIKPNDNDINRNSVDSKTDLKDFINLSLFDVADNNRNYFLDTMMALTKQNLYLKKQLAGMNNKIQDLVQNQNASLEGIRKLSFEIEQLNFRLNKE